MFNAKENQKWSEQVQSKRKRKVQNAEDHRQNKMENSAQNTKIYLYGNPKIGKKNIMGAVEIWNQRQKKLEDETEEDDY